MRFGGFVRKNLPAPPRKILPGGVRVNEGTGGAMALSILAKNDDPTSPLRKGYPQDALFAGNKVELRGANKVGGARTRRELFCSGRLQAGPYE
jgi:hypothetical protein